MTDIKKPLKKLKKERTYFAIKHLREIYNNHYDKNYSTAAVSSKLAEHMKTKENPEVMEVDVFNNQKLFAFSDHLTFELPLFNRRLSSKEMHHFVKNFKSEIEEILLSVLKENDIDLSDSFILDFNSKGELIAKFQTRKVLRKEGGD